MQARIIIDQIRGSTTKKWIFILQYLPIKHTHATMPVYDNLPEAVHNLVVQTRVARQWAYDETEWTTLRRFAFQEIRRQLKREPPPNKDKAWTLLEPLIKAGLFSPDTILQLVKEVKSKT